AGRAGADGRTDVRDGRLRSYRRNPQKGAKRRAASTHHRDDRPRHEGRPGKASCGRDGRLPSQAHPGERDGGGPGKTGNRPSPILRAASPESIRVELSKTILIRGGTHDRVYIEVRR